MNLFLPENNKKLFSEILKTVKREIKKQTVIDEVSTPSFTFLGRGFSRAVYRYKDSNYVVKVTYINLVKERDDPENDHTKSNETEYVLFNKMDESLKKFFAETYAYLEQKFYSVVISEFVDYDSDLKYAQLRKFDDEVNSELIKRYKIELNDLHEENVKLVQGQPKILDYGFYRLRLN